MIFNEHSELSGKHAFLSPSSYHWINYSPEKLEARYIAASAARLGSEMHDFANSAIKLGIKLPDVEKTLNMYVNDAISFKMESERGLYYSPNCFGTCDAISFRKDKLRIHDLKTGVTNANHHQLEVYAALFCLEYGYSPANIDIELRIYQSDQVRIEEPYSDVIETIMDTIVDFDLQIEAFKEGGL